MAFRVPDPVRKPPRWLTRVKKRGPRQVNGAWLRWRRERAGVSLRRFTQFWGFGEKRIRRVEANLSICTDEELRAYRHLGVKRPAVEESREVPTRAPRADGTPWVFGGTRRQSRSYW